MKGKYVRWPERGMADLAEEEIRAPKADEVVIRAEVSLISPGTERAFLLGLPNATSAYPSRCGYNHVGQVIEAGSAVSKLKVGQRVASAANHAEYVIVPEGKALPLPEGLSSRKAVFFNMLAIALQGVRKARVELGDSVLVIGQGLIGNLALQLAKLSGGFPAIAMDTEPKRLDLARKCGADEILDSTVHGHEERLLGCTRGRGPSVVIEATGHPEPVNLAFRLAAPLGRVVLLASTRGETPKVNFYRDVHKKGLVVLGAHASIRPQQDSTPGFWKWEDDARLLLDLLDADRLAIDPLISHEFDAAEASKAYQLLVQWDPGLMGALLFWNRSL